MELAGRPTAGLGESERLSVAARVYDSTLRYALIMRVAPQDPHRAHGVQSPTPPLQL